MSSEQYISSPDYLFPVFTVFENTVMLIRRCFIFRRLPETGTF
jgi:hypothetical protein